MTLSAADERDLLRRAQAGDAQARADLLLAHRPYCRQQARLAARGPLRSHRDDLEQVALAALDRSILRYDFAHHHRLIALARWHIRGALVDYRRRRHLLHAPAGRRPLVAHLLHDHVDPARPEIDALADQEFVRALLATCTARERDILLRHAAGEKAQSIGNDYGHTRHYICQVVAATLKRLRRIAARQLR